MPSVVVCPNCGMNTVELQQLPNMGFLKKLFGANDAQMDANDSHIHRRSPVR